ncbi:DNA replication/repair protein RecF [Treponema sp.]|uniref:DNA replication/repair protein RecF n=1 Tax=Treponema sp. TaxID=166 RepID=UPI00298EA76B|nr:DNA replication and repair protein RecF [Treponema sp.]MCR5612912.1 DNA replication and repair protein RecF [Treponema sp.]
MPFLNISFYNFRNLDNNKIDLLSKEVYFVGENGQGKSNILEALYYCAYGNSFRTHFDSEIIKHGQKDFSIKALYQDSNESTKSINVYYENSKKRIEKNGKNIQDRKELINTMPCILFCHDDMDFVIGDPGRKRFFIDQSLSLYDVLYIDVIRKYKQILKSRNLLLKEQKYDMLDVYDIQLAQVGLEIEKKRKAAIFKFNEIFSKLYQDISGIENVRIFYEPSWKEIEDGISKRPPNENEVLNILLQKREIDKVMGTTMSGPHRDKIKFVKDNMLFVPVASTGQRRLIALLLRVSQAVFYSQITREKPILLMDDVMLELDPDKRQKLTSMLPEYDQLFCTFLPGEPYERYKHTTTKVINIKDGAWYE